MTRVKILYHDNCFDGAASASLFARFYAEKMDPTVSFTFVGKAHGGSDVYGPGSFDGDVNAVVDFRYSANPRLDWWFDHHVSAFPTKEDEAHYGAHPSPHHFFDPTARSCTKFLADTCTRLFGWETEPYRELIHWADIIDGALFESPQAAVELAEPALQLMTWVENNHDPHLKLRFIDDLTSRPLHAIAQDAYVKDALTPILARHARAIEVLRARAKMVGKVVTFDVADEGLDASNKFIPYYLHPECHYVVGISQNPSRAKISVGSNPWYPGRRTANIARICERYGGGGHPVVGAVSLPAGELARAREIAQEIADELARAAEGEK